MSDGQNLPTKTVTRSELIEILIRENECNLEDARLQVGVITSKGLIIKGVRYTVSD